MVDRDNESEPVAQAIPQRRVLLVDDSRLQRAIISASLKKWGYAVTEAESGQEALDKVWLQPPDIILSDWMMPGMNGLEFCQAFRALPNETYSYFILLTSKSEKNEIAQGLDSGADDFLTKPVSPHELRARLTAGERILDMQRQLTDQNRIIGEKMAELQRLYDSIDQDLIQARKIQQSLVPDLSRDFGDSRVSLLLKPCGHVGGDLVGMFAADERHIGFYSIDVSGHGITSALMTARVSGYLSSDFPDQNVAIENTDRGLSLRRPEEVAHMLNQRLSVDHGVAEYFTMVYGTADLKTGLVRLVQAGHPHPIILRVDGTFETIGNGGLPIGLIQDVTYEGFEIALQPGDKLFLCSDGFTECTMKNGEMLETEGLISLISDRVDANSGSEFLDDLFWQLQMNMSDETGLEDDVSATLFEFQRIPKND